MKINGNLQVETISGSSTATEIVVQNTTTKELERRTTLPQSSITNLTSDLAAKQPLDATLTSLAAYNTNGLVTQTAADTFVGRTIVGPAAGFTVSNGSGVGGNPTFALANDLAALEGLGGTGVAVRTGTETWTNRTISGTTNQIVVTNGSGVAGNPTIALDATVTSDIANKQPLDATLTALAAFNTNGIVVQTAADTFVGRTLTAPAAGITITNPAGTAGNPTFVLANDLAALEGLAGTGFAARTTTDTWAQRTLTAPAAGFTITNPAGIAGNPTFVLADDLNALENLAVTGMIARTATNTWTSRTITGTAGQITVVNGDGIAGNPTLSLDTTIANPEFIDGSTGTNSIRSRTTFNDATGNNAFSVGGAGTTAGTTKNVASGIQSTTVGGAGNTASSSNSATLGGVSNTASNTASSVIGGSSNTASGSNSAVVGGNGCSVQSTNSGVFSVNNGDILNISTFLSSASVIAGGIDQLIIAQTANNINAAIVGGTTNQIGNGSSSAAMSNNAILGGNVNVIQNGSNSAMIGGQQNLVSASKAVALGGNNSNIFGDGSVSIGSNHSINSALSLVIGDSHNPASSALASLSYGTNTQATHYGEIASSIGNVGGLLTQYGTIMLNGQTTTTTAFDLMTGDGNNGILIPTNESWTFNIRVVSVVQSATNRGNSKSFEYKVKAVNKAGVTTATVLNGNSVSDASAEANAQFTVTQNTIVSNRLQVRVTATTALTTLAYVAVCEYTRVKFL